MTDLRSGPAEYGISTSTGTDTSTSGRAAEGNQETVQLGH